MEIKFASGAWVKVIPPQNLKMRHRDSYWELLQSEAPIGADDELDMEVIRKEWGSWVAYNRQWEKRRRALIAAIVIEDWSYPVDRPAISGDGTQLLNRESLGEADMEIVDVLEMYLEQFTREPDPKAPVAVTTTSSNSRSRAKAPAPTA